MQPIEFEKARDRVQNLRARLADTNRLLDSVARKIQAQDSDTRNDLRIATRAIAAVIDDLETVCSDHLNDPLDNYIQKSAVNRARSEVDSGEFDSQG